MGRKRVKSATKDIDMNDLSYENEFEETSFKQAINCTPLASFNFNKNSILVYVLPLYYIEATSNLKEYLN